MLTVLRVASNFDATLLFHETYFLELALKPWVFDKYSWIFDFECDIGSPDYVKMRRLLPFKQSNTLYLMSKMR